VILSLTFWGMVWGGVGMLVAVPLLVSLKIVLEHIPATVPLARLMAGS
jgi:AI-2 transport protein TqsA